MVLVVAPGDGGCRSISRWRATGSIHEMAAHGPVVRWVSRATSSIGTQRLAKSTVQRSARRHATLNCRHWNKCR